MSDDPKVKTLKERREKASRAAVRSGSRSSKRDTNPSKNHGNEPL